MFLNLQGDTFSQNRLYGALGYTFNKNIRGELGFLKNHIDTRNFDRLQAAVFINADFRKKTKEQ